MPAEGAIRVSGLRELDRAFGRASRLEQKTLRSGLRAAAEPVRVDAERLAVAEISHIGDRWSRMRVGFAGAVVYVAPRQRGRLSRANPLLRRPNLARLLLERAMEPALERNREVVARAADHILADVEREWERV